MKNQVKIKRLQASLTSVSDKKTKDWFENYLKGSIQYRGVKTPLVLKITKAWRAEEAINELPPKEQIQIASNLIRQPFAEDKFAGILYFQNFLLKTVDFDTLADEFETLFEKGCFFDWSTTDWFNVRVLSPLALIHGKKAIKRFASWNKSKNLWQQRSSIVFMRAIVKEEKYVKLIESQILRLVKNKERFIQTGIGWVIADLSKHHPQSARKIVEKNLKFLSVEVMKRHTKYIPGYKKLIEKHKKLNF